MWTYFKNIICNQLFKNIICKMITSQLELDRLEN